MQLNERALEMQNAILLAVHKTDDIEEAESKEYSIFYASLGELGEFYKYEYVEEILPPTLDRVLVALGKEYSFRFGNIEKDTYSFNEVTNLKNIHLDFICRRKLLNDDGTPCNLFEQDQSVIDALYPLLVK